MKRSIAAISAAICLSLGLASCLEELENTNKITDINFAPSIDFPLVNSDFTMAEFLTEGRSQAQITEEEGLLILTYDDSISTPAADMFFTLPDQQSPTLSITGSEIVFPGSGATITISKSLDFNFTTSQGEVLDSVLLKAGSMLLQVSSTLPSNINLQVNIPTLQRQNIPFARSFVFNGPSSQNTAINLSNAVFDLTDNGTSANKVRFQITVEITDNGQAVANTDRLDVSFGINNMSFRGLFGDLGTQVIPVPPDSINVDVFNNALSGSITLLAPSMKLSMYNSFGLPIGFNVQNVSAIKGNASVATLSGPALSSPANPYLLGAPSYQQIGQSADSEIQFTPTNSNLSQLISSVPQYLSYQFQLTLNPAAASKNFVLDTSRLNMGIHLELPFHGQLNGLTLSKQFNFNRLGINDAGQTKIKVKTVNETPLEMSVQVYFVDITGAVLDSLFINRRILQGAPVDANAFTRGSGQVEMEVPVSKEKIARIEQAEFLVVEAIASSTNNGSVPVKFSTADRLRISLGVNTKVKYKLN